jgi:hypothetical protein
MNMFKELTLIYDYLFSIRKLENYLSFDVKLPAKWTIPKNIVDTAKVVENQSNEPELRFFSFVSEFNETSINTTLGIVKSLIKINKEREEKERLFKTKVNDLKILFDNTSLDNLKQLTFDIKEDGQFQIDSLVRASENEG